MTVHREPKFANKDIYLVACEDASSVKEKKNNHLLGQYINLEEQHPAIEHSL